MKRTKASPATKKRQPVFQASTRKRRKPVGQRTRARRWT